LEERTLFSVTSQLLQGDLLVVKTNNDATSVTVNQIGAKVRLSEAATSSPRYAGLSFMAEMATTDSSATCPCSSSPHTVMGAMITWPAVTRQTR
jgi:hypothetical protein